MKLNAFQKTGVVLLLGLFAAFPLVRWLAGTFFDIELKETIPSLVYVCVWFGASMAIGTVMKNKARTKSAGGRGDRPDHPGPERTKTT